MKTILSICICLAMLFGCTPEPVSGMDIRTFSIGKADCSLLSFDGYNVLIDTGEEDDGDDILEALKKLQVKKLDLVILTHFDKDHIGGFPELAAALPVDRVILPDYVRSSDLYDAMTASIEEVPYALLHHIVNRITNEVKGVNRVLFDLTPKPTGTIEWE